MTEQYVSAGAGTAPSPAARLEPDAIGLAQDTVIGLASSAPAASIGLTLATVVAASAYGGGVVILLTAVPMLIIAYAYHRLNLWNANCGASFEWVGRAINPYLGFLTGWFMAAGYVIATVSCLEVMGPSILAVFGQDSANKWGNVGIATAITLVMLVVAVVGIRLTARTQVGMAVVEYTILIGFAIAGLAAVLGHRHGSVHFTSAWLSPTGVGGKASVSAGFLAAVFMFTGWDGTLYVNEEVKHRRVNPGRAAMIAVAALAAIYAFSTVGLQGVVSNGKLQDNSSSALVYIAQSLGGSGWAKVMALGLALSVIATLNAGIVLTARIVYGMASYRTLPEFLGNVSRRFATPVEASVFVGLLVLGLTWIYLFADSLKSSFDDVVAISGILFAIFYILTALATIVYYRSRVLSNVKDAIVLGLLPLGAAGFLAWLVEKSLQQAPSSQVWSVVGVFVAGLLMMLVARFVLRSPFFSIERESSADES
jgi:amino acid transporter